jgi:hypothetical protein
MGNRGGLRQAELRKRVRALWRAPFAFSEIRATTREHVCNGSASPALCDAEDLIPHILEGGGSALYRASPLSYSCTSQRGNTKMPDKWDPRAKPPPKKQLDSTSPTYESDLDEKVRAYFRWENADLAAFQRERPDLPQGDIGRLSVRQRRQLTKARNQAREAAELEDAENVSPEYAAIVERFHRTGIISTTQPRKRPIQFHVTDMTSVTRAMESARSGTAITMTGTVGDKVLAFTGVVKSIRQDKLVALTPRWRITMRNENGLRPKKPTQR